MNIHMREKHSKFYFQCSMCQTLFKSYNAAYRHTQTHYKLRYLCDIYGHRSQYPGGADAHMKMHMKTKMVPCTWRGCKKQFTSKKSMWQHLQGHGPDTWKCEKCNPPKTFDVYSYFRQHDRGIHGTGWMALCGQLCQWPHIQSKHQRKCDKYKDIKEECANKLDNPRKFTHRNLTKLKKKDTEDPKSDDGNTAKQ